MKYEAKLRMIVDTVALKLFKDLGLDGVTVVVTVDGIVGGTTMVKPCKCGGNCNVVGHHSVLREFLNKTEEQQQDDGECEPDNNNHRFN